MPWVEIREQRVLEVTTRELDEQYERRGDVGEHGKFIRSDNRVFRVAAIQPADAGMRDVLWLSEV